MSRSRSRPRRTPTLSDDAILAIDDGLRGLAATSCHTFNRRSGRLALTFRPRDSGHESLPTGFAPLDAWRLTCLGYRLVADGRGGLRKRAPLAIYRPRADLPGTGRIRFDCGVVFDAAARGPGAGPLTRLDLRRDALEARAAVLLHEAVEDARLGAAAGPILPRFYWAFLADRTPVFEATHDPEEWSAAEVRIGEFRAWPAEMLARRPGRRYGVHPVDGSPDPWTGEGEADVVCDDGARRGDEVRGGWLRRAGASVPLAQEPAAIYASLDHLRGRSVRNPAFAALRAVGLLPGAGSYREWLASLGRAASAGPGRAGPGGASPEVEAFRARVEAYAASSPAAEAGLMAAVAAGCDAAGVAVPGDGEDALQFLAGLVMSPWGRVEVPGAAAVQVLRPAGLPGPTDLSFSDDVADLDLDDLGDHGAPYEPLPPDAIRAALRGRRSGSPARARQSAPR